jgi:16S rRNA (uracil1498-N3)-methyltransferase
VLTLDAEDSHHASRVLRLRPGDECEVVVGAAVYAATMLATAPGGSRAVQVSVGRRVEGRGAGASYRFPVVLVQALTRPAALDWCIEKSTETGVTSILLVPAAGSPRPAGKDSAARAARWARIAREAAKQSKQPAVPPVEVVPSPDVVEDRLRSLGLIPVLLDPEAEESLFDVVRIHGTPPAATASPGAVQDGGAGGPGAAPERCVPAGVALWVGPEGGWTDEERAVLVAGGAMPARLGRGVLRTETAGPVAVAVARLALGDW